MPEHTATTTTVVEPGTDTEVQDPTAGTPRIKCPRCGWSPRQDSRWICQCGHSWNTFDTGGVCPSCLQQWTSTQCLQCGNWSPHSDWYPQD